MSFLKNPSPHAQRPSLHTAVPAIEVSHQFPPSVTLLQLSPKFAGARVVVGDVSGDVDGCVEVVVALLVVVVAGDVVACDVESVPVSLVVVDAAVAKGVKHMRQI